MGGLVGGWVGGLVGGWVSEWAGGRGAASTAGVLLLRCAKKHNVGGYHRLAHLLLQKMLAALVCKRSPFRRYS